MPHTKTKERMTVSLSRESAKFLRAQRAEAQSPSMSALLEKIVGDLQGRIEMEQFTQKSKPTTIRSGNRTCRKRRPGAHLGKRPSYRKRMNRNTNHNSPALRHKWTRNAQRSLR